jgi:hypothetical protein
VKEKHSSNPLKRFGTVLGRRRQSTHPYSQASSSDQKSSSNLGSAFSGFGKAKSKDREPPGSADRPGSPLRPLPETARSPEPESPKNTRAPSTEPPNSVPHDIPLDSSVPTVPNGTVHDSIPELIEPLAPPPTEETKPEVYASNNRTLRHELTSAQPQKDAEGFSVPPSALDAITEAEREAGL